MTDILCLYHRFLIGISDKWYDNKFNQIIQVFYLHAHLMNIFIGFFFFWLKRSTIFVNNNNKKKVNIFIHIRLLIIIENKYNKNNNNYILNRLYNIFD